MGKLLEKSGPLIIKLNIMKDENLSCDCDFYDKYHNYDRDSEFYCVYLDVGCLDHLSIINKQ